MQNNKWQEGGYFREQNIWVDFPFYLWRSPGLKFLWNISWLPLPRQRMSNWYAKVVNNIFRCLIQYFRAHGTLLVLTSHLWKAMREINLSCESSWTYLYHSEKCVFQNEWGILKLPVTTCRLCKHPTQWAKLLGTQDRQVQKFSCLLRPTKDICAMPRNVFCSARAKLLSQPASWNDTDLDCQVFSPFLCQRFARKNYK